MILFCSDLQKGLCVKSMTSQVLLGWWSCPRTFCQIRSHVSDLSMCPHVQAGGVPDAVPDDDQDTFPARKDPNLHTIRHIRSTKDRRIRRSTMDHRNFRTKGCTNRDDAKGCMPMYSSTMASNVCSTTMNCLCCKGCMDCTSSMCCHISSRSLRQSQLCPAHY